MIRKIKRVIAVMLVAASIIAIGPTGITNITANAASVPPPTPTEDEYILVEKVLLKGKLSQMYNDVSINAGTVSQFEKCGTISYILNETSAETIATGLSDNAGTINTVVHSMVAYPAPLGDAATKVSNELVFMDALKSTPELLVPSIQAEAKQVNVYKYTVTNGGSTVAQGFAVGGVLGLATYPSDTYLGTRRNATYNSIALVPSLPFTAGTAGTPIDLTASGMNVICDGVDINIIDTTHNKVYAINNPVYKMLKVPSLVASPTPLDYTDKLNVVDFTGVTKLSGFSTSIDLASQGISTTILGISLTTSDSTPKNYSYALPVDAYEKAMLDAYIDSMNLSTVGTTIKGMIKSGNVNASGVSDGVGAYTMVPNASSEVGNLIDKSGLGATFTGVTTGLNNMSDSLNDLADSINDKNDDVTDAWDKVFDRFDNDKGWGERDGYKYYYDKDGVSLKGVQKINGKNYYFNRIDGAMETGWQIVDGKRCYFDKKKGYQASNQWVEDNGEKYFVGEDGTVKKMDWVSVGGKNYYFKADGKMAKDWFKIDDYWYFFNDDGSMATSIWKKNKDKWHYLKENGQSAIGWLQLGESWYYFKDPSAELQTGWFRADGSWYYSNEDGSMKKGWAESSDGWCYLDDSTGKMKKNEWVTVDGKTYYFNVNGIMVTGSRYINGTKYMFNSDGILS